MLLSIHLLDVWRNNWDSTSSYRHTPITLFFLIYIYIYIFLFPESPNDSLELLGSRDSSTSTLDSPNIKMRTAIFPGWAHWGYNSPVYTTYFLMSSKDYTLSRGRTNLISFLLWLFSPLFRSLASGVSLTGCTEASVWGFSWTVSLFKILLLLPGL